MSIKSSERNFARRIDLTSLQLFVAVCELGSIGKAALGVNFDDGRVSGGQQHGFGGRVDLA